MKTGRSIHDLAREILRQKDAKQDYLVMGDGERPILYSITPRSTYFISSAVDKKLVWTALESEIPVLT